MFVKCSCKHCKNNIEFDSQWCGESIECPHCKGRFTLPKDNELKPVRDEREWHTDDGVITHLKCPTCRRMVLVDHDSKMGERFSASKPIRNRDFNATHPIRGIVSLRSDLTLDDILLAAAKSNAQKVPIYSTSEKPTAHPTGSSDT